MSSDKFAIELALARMAIVFMSRHKDDEGCARVVHQVRRLGHAYLVDDNDMDRGQKLARLIKWWDDGCPEPPENERIVLSESVNK